MEKLIAFLAFAASIAGVVGCSGSDANTSGVVGSAGSSSLDQGLTDAGCSSRVCEPGRQVSCACPDGTTAGAQTCATDGMSWGACACAAATTTASCHRVGIAVANAYGVQIGVNPACGQVTTVGSLTSLDEQPRQYLWIGCTDTSITSGHCAPVTVDAYSGIGAYCCDF